MAQQQRSYVEHSILLQQNTSPDFGIEMEHNASPKKLEAMKERHARTNVSVRYDPETHEVRIVMPDTLGGMLFGEGASTLEVLRGKTSRIKLRERDTESMKG